MRAYVPATALEFVDALATVASESDALKVLNFCSAVEPLAGIKDEAADCSDEIALLREPNADILA